MTAIATRAGRPRDPAVDAAIARAALGLLAEGGFDGITMEAIAARAGIGKATLYRRFASREEVIRDALGTLNDDLPDALALLEAQGLRAALASVIDGIRSRSPRTEHGRIVLRVMVDQVAHPELHALVLERVIEPRSRRLRALIELAIERGELRDDVDPSGIVALLVGPGLYLGMRGIDEAAATSAAVVDALLEGLSPARATRS